MNEIFSLTLDNTDELNLIDKIFPFLFAYLPISQERSSLEMMVIAWRERQSGREMNNSGPSWEEGTRGFDGKSLEVIL